MSSDLAIRFEGVGKEYRVGAAQSGGRFKYQSLGERLGGALRNPFRAAAGALRRAETDSFWALKDVTFDVRRGEVVGVIGRNGAGKSTLLKILSQITRPSEGQIKVHGRVGSLLEVGTGFHPELTGRENIFLNGAILGMTQREVRSKFDEIVAFSEVERFLDTPVKQYSSGMYTRLAFAVAAHLDPEILVVDEVLAVGDAEFQKKCLGKMQDVASGGRTVLFVSHNMSAVARLCGRAACLETGRLIDFGPTSGVVRHYLSSDSEGTKAQFSHGPLLGASVKALEAGFEIEAEYHTKEAVDLPALGFVLSTSSGMPVCGDNPRISRVERTKGSTTHGIVRVSVREPTLRDGDYSISLWFGNSVTDLGSYPDALTVTITGQESGAATSPTLVGPVVPRSQWQFLNGDDSRAR